jgi:hypothetical protein
MQPRRAGEAEAAFAAPTSGAARWQEFAHYISGPCGAPRGPEALLAGGGRTLGGGRAVSMRM